MDLYHCLYRIQKCRNFYLVRTHIESYLLDNPKSDVYEFEHYIKSLNPVLWIEYEKLKTPVRVERNKKISRIHFGEPGFPVEFRNLQDSPLVLAYLGRWPDQGLECLSVIGSREPSLKSIWWLDFHLEKIIETYHLYTCSGAARGIDQAVHRKSMQLKTPSVFILPSGLDQIYPKNILTDIYGWLDEGALVLSEYEDNQIVQKYHFHHRNRLIAALGKCLLVVEAKNKSGSLMTAHRALELGKDVLIVPGHPSDMQFQGNLEILKFGGISVTSCEDLEFWFHKRKKGKD